MVSLSVLTAILASLRIYVLFHRIFFSTLAKYPGPPLAGFSRVYRMYYDIWLGGRWVDHLHKLHAAYGLVVRVGPHELSFSDPLAYGDIYVSSKTSKDPYLYACFSSSASSFTTLDAHEAAKIRQPLAPFFSRRAILRLETVIQSYVDKLVDKLSVYENEGRAANLHRAFRSTTLDIISAYCFASSPDTLDAPNFEHELVTSLEPTVTPLWIFKHFFFVRRFILGLPFWLVGLLNPKIKASINQRVAMTQQINGILDKPAQLMDAEHPTIYHNLLTHVQQEGYSRAHIQQILLEEGLLLRFAGSDTVGTTCCVVTTYLLRDEQRRKRLFDELKTIWPDRDDWKGYETLEKLPYLTAVIKEGLRLASAVRTPLARIVGPEGALITGLQVPSGTVVSVGPTLVHLNPEIFPEPDKFIPERWLKLDSSKLDKFIVAFSRGPRACIGINLAWCEMYLILGNIFRKLDLREDDSQLADLHPREYFIPVYDGNKLHAHVRRQTL